MLGPLYMIVNPKDSDLTNPVSIPTTLDLVLNIKDIQLLQLGQIIKMVYFLVSPQR